MQYFVQFDVHQPIDMSREELFSIWLEEARAAQGAVDAGVVTNLWKVVGQRSVFAVLDVPDHTSLDQALESLPIVQKLGGSVDTRAYAIRPYSEWAEELQHRRRRLKRLAGHGPYVAVHADPQKPSERIDFVIRATAQPVSDRSQTMTRTNREASGPARLTRR